MNSQIHCSKSCPILELSVKFASQIYHENINKPLDGTYLSDFGIDINLGITIAPIAQARKDALSRLKITAL